MITFLWFVSLVGVFVFGFLNERYSRWWFAGACVTAAIEVVWFAPEAADATWYLMYLVVGIGALWSGGWASSAGLFEVLYWNLTEFFDFGPE